VHPDPAHSDRGAVRNVEFYSKNKFEKLVHLVGCIILQEFILAAAKNILPPHLLTL